MERYRSFLVRVRLNPCPLANLEISLWFMKMLNKTSPRTGPTSPHLKKGLLNTSTCFLLLIQLSICKRAFTPILSLIFLGNKARQYKLSRCWDWQVEAVPWCGWFSGEVCVMWWCTSCQGTPGQQVQKKLLLLWRYERGQVTQQRRPSLRRRKL